MRLEESPLVLCTNEQTCADNLVKAPTRTYSFPLFATMRHTKFIKQCRMSVKPFKTSAQKLPFPLPSLSEAFLKLYP